jgi:4-hydroxyproline epimerase
VVIASPMQLGGASMAEKCTQFGAQFDRYRQAIVCEPRGSDIMVGALLTEPVNAQSVAGVIFFNNVGTLGMCGHGLIGVAVVLRHLQRIKHGRNSIDTPVGTVHFEMLTDNQVRIENVLSYRWKKQQAVEIFPGTSQRKTIHGDIAWGGNWFFICEDHGEVVASDNIEQLERISLEIRHRLDELRIAGRDGQVIDHIELIAPSLNRDRSDAKSFVLCPGAAYDRSPCGTGTSAKLACLAADGKLGPGKIHRQESIVGSVFTASYQLVESTEAEVPQHILPTIVGSAYITGEAELLLDNQDPFCWGLFTQ